MFRLVVGCIHFLYNNKKKRNNLERFCKLFIICRFAVSNCNFEDKTINKRN